jgi:MFS superfamily sulfate permease-like transporter
MAKPMKNRHSKILRDIQRYSNDNIQRPKRKIRLAVLTFALLLVWPWTTHLAVSGPAWLAFLVIGIFMALDIRYLLGRNPMDSVIHNMAKQFDKHSDY